MVVRGLCLRTLLVVLAAGCSVLQAQSAGSSPALPSGITRGPSVEGITEYDMQNGLRVLLFPDPTKATTTVNITYLVGSRNESYGETGMAHLLEHMLFKGTPKHPNIPQELTEHGARPNGTTSFDRTNYFETFQSSDVNLNWALDLEADRMVNSYVAKTGLDSEMTVVRNEFEMGENSPANILEERVLSTAYLWHNYGKSTIGSRSDIEHVPIERLQAFYRRYYQPDNAVLTVAGKMDEAQVLALVAKYFGAIPKPTRVLEKTYTEEPVQDGERTVMLRRAGDQKVMMVGVHVPALAHPDGALASLIGDVFSNAPSGRLYKALVETKKAGSVANDTTDTREPGMLILMALAPKEADLDDIRKTFLQVMDEMESTPPTEAEVNRSKTKFDTQFDLLLRNSERVGLTLSEYIAAGDWRLAFITRDRIRDAKTADVDRVARTYLKESNRTVGLFIPTDKPDRAEIPQTPDIQALVKDYKGGEVMAAGEAFDPSPANIDKRTVRGELQPGIKLAMISKKTRGGVVHATLRLHFGDENNLRAKDAPADLTGSMLMRGTDKRTRQQITDDLNKLKAQVRVRGSTTGATVSVQTTKENFPAVMQIVGEVLRQPSFPASEFEALKQQQLTFLESQRAEPTAIAQLSAERHLHPYPKGDVRYVYTIDEQIADVKATKLEDVKNFYQQFYGTSKAEFAVIGDVDAEAVQKQVSQLFNNWTSKAHYQRVVTDYKQVPPVNQSFETPDKANATFVAVQPVKMDDENPDYPALLLSNYMLGGGFLNSRLATRIRVKEGLSYGVGSQLSVPTKEDSGMFLTYAIARPQNMANVESSFKDEVAKALQNGFTAEEIAAAKSGWLQSRQVSRGQDNELTSRLANQAYWDRTMQWDAKLEAAVNSLTAEQVNSTIRKYLNLGQISIFKAGDFAKAKASAASVPSTK
ncbi:MAG: M16 family metallopeptidase [Bryobacteraceae bacterium]